MMSGVFAIPLDVPDPTSAPNCRTNARRSPTLRHYIAGPENALVHLAASRLGRSGSPGDPPNLPNPIYLYGASGTGKTELGHALTAMWQRSHPLLPVVIITGPAFLRGYCTAVGRDAVAHWQARFAQASMVFLDDADRLAGRSSTEEFLARVIDGLVSEGRPVLVTGGVHPANHAHWSPRLASRLSGGLTIPLHPPGLEARRHIFQQLTTLRGLSCTNAAAEYTARHTAGTVSELNDLIGQLLAAGPDQPDSIQETDVRRALAPANDRADDVSPGAVIRTVARHYHVPISQLTGPSRRQSLVQARAIAIYLIRRLARISLQQIGAYFGGRDHTTVLHALRAAESRINVDPNVRQAVSELLSSINGRN